MRSEFEIPGMMLPEMMFPDLMRILLIFVSNNFYRITSLSMFTECTTSLFRKWYTKMVKHLLKARWEDVAF